jgi:hypothetical protein
MIVGLGSKIPKTFHHLMNRFKLLLNGKPQYCKGAGEGSQSASVSAVKKLIHGQFHFL